MAVGQGIDDSTARGLPASKHDRCRRQRAVDSAFQQVKAGWERGHIEEVRRDGTAKRKAEVYRRETMGQKVRLALKGEVATEAGSPASIMVDLKPGRQPAWRREVRSLRKALADRVRQILSRSPGLARMSGKTLSIKMLHHCVACTGDGAGGLGWTGMERG